MKKVKHLVVGSGLSGIVLAERIASQLNEEVLVIDQRDHLGGNCYDYKEHNIHVHKYGTHILHTSDENVWSYLSKFTKWEPYMHEVKGIIDGKECPIPFNINAIQQMFPKSMADKLESKLIEKFGYNVKVPILELRNQEDKDLNFLAEYIYEKIFLDYTVKQWGIKPEDLDPSVTGRVPVYISKDDRYFQCKYQAIPRNGYTAMMQEIVNHPNITLKLNTDFMSIKDEIEYENLYYTGAIDEFFDYKHGELPYRSLTLDFVTYDKEYFQSNSVINYPCNYDFTRTGEYKYFLDDKSDKTIVSYEYPKEYIRGKTERYYPIIKSENQALYEKYLEEAKKHDNIIFFGRLGDYRYYDMDKCVARSLEVFEQIKNK